MYDVSRVSGHRTRDIRRIQHALMVQRQLPQVAEVLNVQVGRHGADEYGLVLEGIREGVRNTNRHDDDRARFNIDVVITTGEPHLAGGDDKDLLVFVMYVLRRLGRPWREGRLHKAQTVPRMGAVLDDAGADRPTAGLLARAELHEYPSRAQPQPHPCRAANPSSTADPPPSIPGNATTASLVVDAAMARHLDPSAKLSRSPHLRDRLSMSAAA
jgi:hypothetical protein